MLGASLVWTGDQLWGVNLAIEKHDEKQDHQSHRLLLGVMSKKVPPEGEYFSPRVAMLI